MALMRIIKFWSAQEDAEVYNKWKRKMSVVAG